MFTGIIEKIGKVSHVTEKNILILTANQWFDDSILTETSIKKFYFPSINLKNYKSFNKKFLLIFTDSFSGSSLIQS